MAPPSPSETHDHPADDSRLSYWYSLFGVITVAMLVRMAFFTGFFGSDEVTYTNAAKSIVNGEWPRSDYTGALRYGMNLPNALFMTLFGVSEFSANLWSLLCSVAEVALVFVFAYRLWGLRAAWLAAAVIGLLPMHVHYGGRLMADAPLAFIISLSFILFWIAEQRQRAAWYFYAGLAAGFVFWIKEVGMIYCAAFGIYAIAYRKWNIKWLWAALGGALMIGANCLVMWLINDDPLHIFKTVREITEKYIHLWRPEDSPWYYIRYLFYDIRHTWLMSFLALGGIWTWARQELASRGLERTTGYVMVWALGLFSIFSFLPISFHPITLIAKQTNYMSIFMAPFCLLAGYFLATLPRRSLIPVLGAYVIGAVILSGLERQAIRVFTANSRATVDYARTQTALPVYGMTNAYRAGISAALLEPTATGKPLIRPLSELSAPDAPLRQTAPPGLRGYAVVDLQTMGWSRGDPIREISDVPACWRRAFQLQPARESGLSGYIATGLFATVQLLPSPFSSLLVPPFEALVRPKPAYVYAVPQGCILETAVSERK